ncbi:MAG: peptidase [Anaerolineae bacterium SM23_ 63]|nr:MAG: peptidase [Anaerolineae bacterium SM23_ 63]
MMTPSEIAPYGSWRSPITPDFITSLRGIPTEIQLSGDDIYWLEMRPQEAGRYVIMRRAADGSINDMTPADFNVRTRVHEYGGGSFTVHGDVIYFSNFSDQRLYRLESDRPPQPITPEPDVPVGLRYAECQVTGEGSLIICVHERHGKSGDVTNELVVLPTDGSQPPWVIADGHDFFSSPRISPDGDQLAWLTWDHPQMPWDGSELWAATLLSDGTLSDIRKVAGGSEESIFQPEWSSDGHLHFISDRTGWWNLYKESDGEVIALAPIEADLGVPQWQFGFSRYAFLADGRVACVYNLDGIHHLGSIASDEGKIRPLETPLTSITFLRSNEDDVLYFVGGNFQQFPALLRMEVNTREIETVYRPPGEMIDPGYLSIPESIEFPTEDGLSAYALFYPPTNRDYIGPPDELPPLLVFSHGGPTSVAPTFLQSAIQYWTSRGIALVDVNYGGSTGYGRSYRNRLKGKWGVVDTADCVAAARYLVEQGRVDGEKLAIRGGSAGGYTTLAALTFYDLFTAGASYYGVADVEALAIDTHKFESRYLDSLIGPYPEAKDLYYSRSPIHFTEQLSCPVIIFQGLEDLVVPPGQADLMVDALRAKGLPYAYLAFEGEQHGFRRAETIQRCLKAELYFYSRIFGFDLADPVEPLDIENL